MRIKLLLSLFLSFFISLFFFINLSSVYAAVGINEQINFQGKLVNTNGTNVTNGSGYEIVFSLYNLSSGGANVWTETQTGVTVTDGIFRVSLGSVSSLSSVDFNNDSIYLGVQVTKNAAGGATGDAEMTPRIRYTAVPYAFNAKKVNGLTVTNSTGTLTIPNSKTISFADSFTTSGANALTLTTSGITNATLPVGTVTLVDLAATQTLTGKTIAAGSNTISGLTNSNLSGTAGITSANLGTDISATNLAATLSFANLDYVDLSAIIHGTTAVMGLRLPNVSSATPSSPVGGLKGFLAYDTAGNQLIAYNGASWSAVGGACATCIINNPSATQTITSTQASGTILGLSDTLPHTSAATGLAIALTGTGAIDQTGISFALTGASGTNLNDLLGSGSTWKVSKAGAATFASVTSGTLDTSGAMAVGANSTGLTLGKAATTLTFLNTAWTATPTISGLITASTGLTVTTGQTFTFNSDAFTDLTGNGLAVSSNALTLNLTSSGTTGATSSNSGLEVSSSGLTLLKGCADNEILKYTDAGGWACSSAGGGSSDLQTTYANDVNGGDATIALTSTDGSVIFQNPASGGTGSGYVFKVDQLAAGAVDGMQISNAGTGSGLNISQTGAGIAIKANTTSTGNLLQLQTNSVDKFVVSNNGGITVNGADSSIVRQTASDFALGTVGSSLDNSNGALSLSDTKSGGIPNTGKGTITIGSQPATSASIGAGSFSITRADGKYLVIRGGGTGIDIYDSVAGTFTNSTLVLNNAAGVGALALPRPGGLYRIVHGGASTTTSLVDPMGAYPVGISVTATANKGAGTVAFLRPDGRYLITNAPTLATTQIYDPIADTFSTGGPSSSGGNWGVGAAVLHRTDGQALILVGGASSNTQLYNPFSGTANIGAFTAGPSLDGNKAVGTCALNGNGAVTFKRQDGKFIILSKINVWAVYDPVANTMTCNSSGGPATAIGDGGHSIPLQNGKFLILVGGGSTNSYVYDPSDDSFTSHGTATTAITTGAHSIMRYDGTWQILVGGATTTNNYDTGLPMSDSNTVYTSEDIFSSSMSSNSSFWWRAQMESVYSGITNASTNTAFSSLQFLVRTAVSSNGNQTGCATPLNSATDIEIRSSGDMLQTVSGANCVRVQIRYNRPLPKRLFDERGVWAGNGMTATRLDYVTPRLYNFKIDNSAVLRRSNFDFTFPNANGATNPTVPSALTATESSGGGSCTAGTHAYYSTFITNGVESTLSTKSNVITCIGGTDKVNLTAIPLGPAGTTARKVYRTATGDTGSPFLVTTIADNTTTTLTSDTNADTSLGAAYVSGETSGPVMTRSETRVETVNGNLVLPYGRLLANSQVGTSGYYMGLFTNAHPLLNNTAGQGTMVIARDDKQFLIIEAGGQTAELYDPSTETFLNQSGAGNIPTGTVGAGAFALKRPDGNFLVYLGLGSTSTACVTSGTATNIYNPEAPSGSHFTNGPCLTAGGGLGAQALLNNDGTYTIVHGNAGTATSVYNPITNTMYVGPVTTTAVNCGSWAIPMGLPNNNQYKVKAGVAPAGTAVNTGMMNYDANNKIFTAAPTLSTITGCGSFAFQRQDGYWLITEGETAGVTGLVTSIMNPITGTTAAGPSMTTNGTGRGAHVIPRADGTYLIVLGNFAVAGTSVLTQIYFPTGGAAANALGVPAGTFTAGPNLSLGGGAAPAALTAGTPTAGGTCDAGTHSYKYTNVTNGVESIAGTVSSTITCVVTTGQTVPLSVIAAGPAGTTARKVYRTAAGAAATGPWKLLTTINDNVTTVFSDTIADASLGATIVSVTGPGDGALSFQRPDGKFVTIFGGSTASKYTNLYDAGWYSEGQYMSEMMQVPALAANSTLEWQKTSDAFVRFEARTASSQTALDVAPFKGVDSPGESINNAGGETWAQVEINFKRDFPTFCGNLTNVYVSGAGMAYCNRTISLPTVLQYQITNGQDLLTLQTNSYNVLRVTSNGGIYSSQQGGFYAGGADLAENYNSIQTLAKGEVVVADTNNKEGVVRSNMPYDSHILGVVSTNPGVVTGAYTKDSYPIALIGRVPVKVSTEGGMIQAGDTLTSSTVPGYAMKAVVSGRVIGKALEDLDSSTLVDCPNTGYVNIQGRKCGEIVMFVNLTDYDGQSIGVAMQDYNAQNPDVEGLQADNSSGVNIETNNHDKVLAFLTNYKEQNPQAIHSEMFTGKVTSLEVTTSEIFTDVLHAKKIKADSIEGLEITADKIVGLEIYTTKLVIVNDKVELLQREVNDLLASHSAVLGVSTSTSSAQINPYGNLSIKDLTADGTATISGDLQIRGSGIIEGILNVIDTLTAKNLLVGQWANFMGDVVFKSNARFEGTPTFNNNTGGIIIIKQGTRKADVVFTKEYSQNPIISTSLTFDAVRDSNGALDNSQTMETKIFNQGYVYLIKNRTTKGFTIVLNKDAEEDLTFSWIALSISDSSGIQEGLVPIISVTPTTVPTVMPTVSPIDIPVQ